MSNVESGSERKDADNGGRGGGPRRKMRFATYNLLSLKLDRADYHVGSEPAHLAHERRIAGIKTKLAFEMERGAVICMQEYGDGWPDALTAFFDAAGYRVVSQVFGKFPQHWGGVAIAVPPHFSLVDSRTVVVGDEIRRLAKAHLASSSSSSSSSSNSPSSPSNDSDEKDKSKTVWSRLTAVVRAGREVGVQLGALLLAGACSKKLGRRWDAWCQPAPPADPIERAAKKEHQMLLAILAPRRDAARVAADGGRSSDSGGGGDDDRAIADQIAVATYHCPCSFTDPELMALHLGVASHTAHTYAAGRPYVFAGDFNQKPGDDGYKLLTGGGSLARLGARGLALRVVPLQSAYAAATGTEPRHTCHSTVAAPSSAAGRSSFTDTLDYILASCDLRVADVVRLPELPTASSHPSADEPSDHLMVVAEYEFA